MSNNLVELAQQLGRLQQEPERGRPSVDRRPAVEPEREPGRQRQTVSVRYRQQVGRMLVVEPVEGVR